jgi:hypothetical protein
LLLYDIDPDVDFVVEAVSHCPSGCTETPTMIRTLLERTLPGGDCRRNMRGRNCRRSRRARRPPTTSVSSGQRLRSGNGQRGANL